MSALLYGWQRRVALVPLTFCMISWIVYTIGFVLKMNSSSQHNSFSLYIILTGSPVVYLLGMLHAILPGIFSAYLWIPLSVASIVCSTSAGWMVYVTVPWPDSTCRAPNNVTEIQEDLSKHANYVHLMFTGTLLGVVSWGVVLLLSVFYQTRSTEEGHNYNEFPMKQGRSLPFFTPGKARLLSIPLIALSFLGWCVFLVGFLLTYRMSDSGVLKPDDVYRYLYDLHSCGLSSVVVLFLIVPLLCVASLLHAGSLGDTGSIAAVFEAMLGTPFVVFMGFIVVQLSDYLNSNHDVTHAIGDTNFYLMLAGGGVSLLLWAFVVALWPFYGKYKHLRDGQNVVNVQRLPEDDEHAHPNYGAVQPPPPARRPRLVIAAAEDEGTEDEEQPLVENNGEN